MASCSKETSVVVAFDDNIVRLSSSIDTRASGTSWSAQDKISVFAYNTDSTSDAIADNILHTANSSAQTTLFTPASYFYYPTDDTNIDVYAIYPYSSSTTITDYSIDVSTAAQADHTLIDLMSAKSTNNEMSTNPIALSFYHKLAQVQVTLSATEMDGLTDEALANAQVTLDGTMVKGNYSILSDEITTSGDKSEIVLEASERSATFMVIPQEEATMEFTITVNSVDYTVAANELTIGGGNIYSYDISVSQSSIQISSSSISSWNDGGGEDLQTGVTEDKAYDIELDNITGDYYINTAMGLEAFAAIVNGTENNGAVCGLGVNFTLSPVSDANAVLMYDVDLSEVCGSENSKSWTPIGIDSNTYYSGTFNGNYYVVKNIYIDGDSTYVGLFGYVVDATIESVGMVGGSVKTTVNSSYVGAVVGYAENSSAISYVTNCYNKGVAVSGMQYTGGVVGYGENTYVTNCYNTGQVVSSSTGSCYTGGIVGLSHTPSYAAPNPSVVNCYNTGAISADSATTAYVAGIAGKISGSKIKVTACYNVGELSANSSTNATIGGIIGYSYSDYVTSCYWASDLCNIGVAVDDAYDKASTTSMLQSEMTGGDLASKLNTAAAAYNSSNPTATQACAWVGTNDEYPTLDFTSQP